MKHSDDGFRHTDRVRRLAELAQEIRPARDLWPMIAASVAAGSRSPTGTVPVQKARWPQWVTGVACASVAMLVVAAVWVQRNGRHAGGAELAAVAAALNADPAYAAERAALIAAMPARIAALSPDAQAGAREGLAAVRKAERELQQAIKADSGDALLLEMLIATRQEEMRVMTNIQDTGKEERML